MVNARGKGRKKFDRGKDRSQPKTEPGLLIGCAKVEILVNNWEVAAWLQRYMALVAVETERELHENHSQIQFRLRESVCPSVE